MKAYELISELMKMPAAVLVLCCRGAINKKICC